MNRVDLTQSHDVIGAYQRGNFEEVISILERNSCRYIELGATNTLANSVRNIISDVSTSEVYELMGAFINTQRVIKNLSKE